MTADGRLLAACVRRPEDPQGSPLASQHVTWCPDEELAYEGFNLDFGPLDLGQTWRFCDRVSALLARAARAGPKRRVYVYSRADPQARANFAVLLGAYLVLCGGAAADAAYTQVQALQPFAPFRDAASTPSPFALSVLDCLRGLQRARDVGHLEGFATSAGAREEAPGEAGGQPQRGAQPAALPPHRHFDIGEYEHWGRLENGDMHWIIPRKFLALSGPQSRRTAGPTGFALTPEDYLNYFGRHRVWAVVRLNTKAYEAARFENRGIRVHEMFFQDGSCPPPKIVRRFLETAEAEQSALAVHCKAGLGRTGVLISLYNMKHFSFTAREALGYIRICRPGSIIGPQQNFLCDMETRMWADGRAWRAQNDFSLPLSERERPSDRDGPGLGPVSAYALAGRLHTTVATAESPASRKKGAARARGGAGAGAGAAAAAAASPRLGAGREKSLSPATSRLLSRVMSETPASPSPSPRPSQKKSRYLKMPHSMGETFITH